ncbi:MAG: MFS transporter [Bryobacteraceae bacterium]
MRRLSLWAPTATMLLVSLISYIDRNTLALLAPTILEETKLTAEQFGFVISAFSIAYMIGNPVWGRWLDRFGLRFGMMIAVIFWSLASISHAFAVGFLGFAAARACLGFGEGATFPGGLRTVVQTLPPSKRSRGVAVAYSGGSLGAVITPIIVTPIALTWGWRAAFIFTGLIGGLWLILWLCISRRPEIKHTSDFSSEEGALDAPRFTDPRVWSFMLAYALGALPIAFVIYVAALYLKGALGLSQAQIGAVLWIPPLGWEIGYFFWGWLIDRSTDKNKSSIKPVFWLLTVVTVLGTPLAFVPYVSSLWAVMFLLFLAMFVAGGFLILTVAYAVRTYSPAHSGLIAGLGAGSWSAAVACVMPIFGRLFDLRQYDTLFLLAAICPIAGYLIWLAINRGVLKTA